MPDCEDAQDKLQMANDVLGLMETLTVAQREVETPVNTSGLYWLCYLLRQELNRKD